MEEGGKIANDVARAIAAALHWSSYPDACKSAVAYLESGKVIAEDSNGCVGRTINLFPQGSGFNACTSTHVSTEPPTAHMTIFYGGQVLVFSD